MSFHIIIEKHGDWRETVFVANREVGEKYGLIGGLGLHSIEDETETGCIIKGLYDDVNVTWK